MVTPTYLPLLVFVVLLNGCAATGIIGNENRGAPLVTQKVPLVQVGNLMQTSCVFQTRDSLSKTAFFGLEFEHKKNRSNESQVLVKNFISVKISGQTYSSPAINSDLRVGDRVLVFAGCPVSHPGQLIEHMWRFTPGNTAVIKVQRQGQVHSVLVTSLDIPTVLDTQYPAKQQPYWR